MALADRLRLLQALGKIKFGAYVRKAGVDFGEITPASYDTRLCHWMADPALKAKLGKNNFQRLATTLTKDFPMLQEHLFIPLLNLIKHPLYHSIANQLNINRGRDNIDYAIQRLVGHYRVYRLSALEQGSAYEGRIEISYDNSFDAFITREQYELPARSFEWDMPGVMFPYSRDKYITVAIDARDGSIQLKCITHTMQADSNLKSNPKQVKGFSGWVADMVGGEYYTTRINAEAIEKNNYFRLNCVTFAKLPQHVQDQLSKKLESRKSSHIHS